MRKTSTLTIDAANRDQGKVFRLTEMSADRAERWAMRAGFLLMNTGVDLPGLEEGASMADLSQMGLQTLFQALSKVSYDQAEPLIDEMLACVQIIPDPNKPDIVRALIDSDIEEVTTRLKLRKAVWDLHVDFFTGAGS